MLFILIGVLVLMIIIMVAVVFSLVYKKVGGCGDSFGCKKSFGSEDKVQREGRAGGHHHHHHDHENQSQASCPGFVPLPSGTKVEESWISKNISPCPDPTTGKFCYYQDAQTGKLCIDGAKHAANEDVCSDQWCPYGMTYTPEGCEAKKGTSFAHDRLVLPPSKPLLTKDQLLKGKAYVEITALDPSIKERYVPRPTLALYHGGVVGQAEMDGEVFKDYMQTVATFCKDYGMDRFLISLDSYTPKGTKGDQYPYLQDPSYLASIVDKVFATTCPSTSLGVVAYVRPKDAGWTDDPMAKGGCIGDPSCGNACEFVSPGPDGCPRYCTTDKNDKDLPLCPPGCPNQLAQAISYVGKVNAKIQSQNLLEAFVFDGEDAGDYASGCGFHLAAQASAAYAKGTIKDFGYAKALQAGAVCYPGDASKAGYCVKGKPVSTMVFPETYWYMNDLWPCTGSPPQLASRPPVCTSQTSYQRFKNSPVAFLNYLQEADRCAYGTNGLVSLKDNLSGPYGDQIWPMFSLEKLSAVGDPLQAGGPSSCLAMAYTGGAIVANGPHKGWPAQSDTCGTFDGFGTWSWPAFLEFISLFAHLYGASKVGIYEAQFLPWSTSGGNSWVKPLNPLPPTVPKACPNDCSYCNFSCTDDVSCTTQLWRTPSCLPTAKGTYTSYCENQTCKIKFQPYQPGSDPCVENAGLWPCTTDANCVVAIKAHPNLCNPKIDYQGICHSGGYCQANPYTPKP